MRTIKLNDGNAIPAIGFGVYEIPDGGPTYEAVRQALRAGYRHIDTAAVYMNEPDVGRAVRDSGIPREELFITSKLWVQDFGLEGARRGIDASLRRLGLDYLDLYLLHQPFGDVPGAWRALEEAKAAGKLRSIGVSNMSPAKWSAYVPGFDTPPAVNQVECHPFFQQRALRAMMAREGVCLEAWSPLGHGDAALLGHPTLAAIADAHGKSPAQVILRFECQEGIVVLPKSVTPSRIAGNLDIFDFELAREEMDAIRALDAGRAIYDPDAPGVEAMLAGIRIHD